MNKKRKHLAFDERQTIKNMLDKRESFKNIYIRIKNRRNIEKYSIGFI